MNLKANESINAQTVVNHVASWGKISKHQKKTDLKGWKEVEQFINQGKIFYRGTRNRDSG